MTIEDAPEGGWEFVAERDAAARLVDALLELDGGSAYTRTELAETADVPLKTLYLNGLLEECADLGILERVEGAGDGEAVYRPVEDSDLLQAAATFEEAFRRQRELGERKASD